MKFIIVFSVLVAAVAGDVSHLPADNYLPPAHQHHAASTPVASFSAAPSYHVETASAPAVSYSAPAVQYYHVEAASAPAVSYAAPVAESYQVDTASAPASASAVQYESVPSYSAAASEPAVQYEAASYKTADSEPAHSYSSNDGYRYKAVRRRVIRRQRRDVSHLSGEYLPPHQGTASAPTAEYLPPAAASTPVAQYEFAPSYSVDASTPAVQYTAPAASHEPGTYESAASEPAHTFTSGEGYRYKTARRRVFRRQRRDVSHLSSEYLPPAAASAPAVQYESAPSFSAAASEPTVQYTAPAASYETTSYETAASEPAHSFSSNDGYRYKIARRRVFRRQRRDVSHLSSEYLPPVAASAPAVQYESAPSYSAAASEPTVEYAAPAASYETASYETAASEPAHSFSSNDGYRYKTARRRVFRRQRRNVSHLSSEYLPPVAASAPAVQYESAPSYSAAASEPAVEYAAPAASYETTSYETAASEPAHSFSSNDGYRYKIARRRVFRRQRRDVSHLSSEYLPPVAASAPAVQYESAPSYSAAASEPTVEYAAPAASYETASYKTAASEPAHSFSSNDGYRYKTARRRVFRRQRRDVSDLVREELPRILSDPFITS